MMNIRFLVFSALLFNSLSHAAKVGMLIVATGKYIEFVPPLIESARQYFLKNHEVTYFVFTDKLLESAHDIVRIEQSRLGWPCDTMMRLEMYAQHADVYKDMDYLYACDADMRFVDMVGDEILSDRVGTQHPGFVGKRGSYEIRAISKAYVSNHEGNIYFAGGFNGGKRDVFLNMCRALANNINDDLKRDVVAVWHDESHINRYYIDNPPTCILNPSYCYPESWQLPYPKKLLALDKNHSAYRAQ